MKPKNYKLWRIRRCPKVLQPKKSGFGALVFTILSFVSFSQVQTPYYELENGLLIDVLNNSVVIMNPSGGIGSLQMNNGNVNWESNRADKPLAIFSGSLIAQQENTEVNNRFKIAQLNPVNGNFIRAREKTLANDVIVTVANKMESSFNAHIDIVNNQINLKYDFVKAPVTLIKDSQKENGVIFRSQNYRMNANNLNLDTINTTAASPQNAWQSTEFYNDQLNSLYAGRQFSAIQNNYRVAVEKIADDREWLKYEWTIFRTNGTKVGSIKSHFSFRPFYIQNETLIFTTSPYERIVNGNVVSTPKSIRGYSLVTGLEIWNREIRDLQYRGPYPP